MNRKEIFDFVQSPSIREFSAASWLVRAADNNQLKEEEWDKRPLKVLCAFLSPGRTRAVSNTYNALQEEVLRVSDEIFIDYAYFPFKGDIEIFDKYGLPYWFGNVSKAPVQDYDVILCSTAILVEILNVFHAFKSCGIPYYHKDRVDDPNMPLIIMGGIPTADHDALGDNSGVVDLIYCGYGEGNLGEIMKGLLKIKKEKESVKSYKPQIIKKIVSTFDNIYYPAGYDVIYEGYKIKEIKPKFNWVPSEVLFHHEHDLNKFNGFENKVFNPDSTNADSIDFLISAGCSGAGACYFSCSLDERVWTDKGSIKAKKLLVGDNIESYEKDKVCSLLDVESDYIREVRFKSGAMSEVHKCHSWMVYNSKEMKLEEVKTFQLKSGDIVFKKLGSDFEGVYRYLDNGKEFNEDLALLTGFIHGDGYVDKDVSINRGEVRIYVKKEETEVIDIVEGHFGNKALREMYKCKDNSYIYEWRKCIEKAVLKPYVEELLWDGRSKNLRVPEIVFGSPRSVISSYLRGYFQADGWVNEEIGVTSISEKMLQDCQHLLLMLGIESQVLTRKKNSKEYFDNYYKGKKNYDVKNSYILRVKGDYRRKFLEEVGFISKFGEKKKEGNGSGNKAEIPVGNLTGWIRSIHKSRKELEKDGLGEIYRIKEKINYQLLKKYYNKYGILPGDLGLLGSGKFCIDEVLSVDSGDIKPTLHINTEKTHQFIMNGILVHNCMEGLNCGGWRERSLENLKAAMDLAIRTSAPNTISPYSFNANYYSHFIDLFYEITKKFSACSLLNMRSDNVAERPEYLKAADVLGITSLSLPIEGYGERIRNNVLNKNLSFEQIKKAFRAAFELGIIRLKIGMVLTGFETEEDFENAKQEFEEILAMKNEYNVGAMIQVNSTMLVHYPKTGCGFLERKSSVISLKKIRLMRPLIEHFRGRIKFKFSSKEYGTFVEQMALDLGRLGTSIWQKAAEQGYYYWGSSYNEGLVKLLVQEIENKGLKLEEILAARPKDWIFPISFIRNKKDKYTQLMAESVGKKPMVPCIKTAVKRDNKCLDCGYCKTKEEINWMLNREISNVHTIQDIEEAKFNNKATIAYRVGFKVKKEYALLGKAALSHYIASRILVATDSIQKFHSVQNVSNNQILQGEIEDWMHGNFFFDLYMKESEEKINDDLCEKLSFVSSELLSVAEVEVGKRINTNSTVLYSAEYAGISESKAKDLIRNFDKKVKYGARGLGSMYVVNTEVKDADFSMEFLIAPIEGGVKMVFKIPINVNPHLYLSSVLKQPLKKVMKDSIVQVVAYLYGTQGFCKVCSGAKELNILSRSELPACSSCLGKALVKR